MKRLIMMAVVICASFPIINSGKDSKSQLRASLQSIKLKRGINEMPGGVAKARRNEVTFQQLTVKAEKGEPLNKVKARASKAATQWFFGVPAEIVTRTTKTANIKEREVRREVQRRGVNEMSSLLKIDGGYAIVRVIDRH